jgi:hypothetical protein
MFLEISQIVLHSRAVADVSKLSKVLDVNDAELSHFCEGVNFRSAQRIGFFTVYVLLPVPILKKRTLGVISGEGWAVGLAVFPALGKDFVGPGFGFADPLQFDLDTSASLPTVVPSTVPIPTGALRFLPPTGIAEIIYFGPVVASGH